MGYDRDISVKEPLLPQNNNSLLRQEGKKSKTHSSKTVLFEKTVNSNNQSFGLTNKLTRVKMVIDRNDGIHAFVIGEITPRSEEDPRSPRRDRV